MSGSHENAHILYQCPTRLPALTPSPKGLLSRAGNPIDRKQIRYTTAELFSREVTNCRNPSERAAFPRTNQHSSRLARAELSE